MQVKKNSCGKSFRWHNSIGQMAHSMAFFHDIFELYVNSHMYGIASVNASRSEMGVV